VVLRSLCTDRGGTEETIRIGKRFKYEAYIGPTGGKEGGRVALVSGTLGPFTLL
jgi:hypothetical protein